MAIQLITDATCDLSVEYAERRGLFIMPMGFSIEGKDYLYDCDASGKTSMNMHAFYDLLRAGVRAKTAQINGAAFREYVTPVLEKGDDIIYLVFSSALSGTYNSCYLEGQQLQEEYPDRKIAVVDTLSASAGEGLLVHLALDKRDEGATFEEIVRYVESLRRRVHHWFTVDDLNHLKAGGRISAAAAFFGTMLSIKPVLDVDNEGRLIPVEKIQGRKRALKTLVDRMEKYCPDPKKSPIFLAHGDSEADARIVEKMVQQRFGVSVQEFGYIGPIIGTHSGPGTVALFFVSPQERE